LNTEIVAVFREEKDGVEGLKKAREKTKAAYPFVLDMDAEKTGAYSTEGFSTYIITAGKVDEELNGTKMIRPNAEKILEALKASRSSN
jgi:hypothetical protein